MLLSYLILAVASVGNYSVFIRCVKRKTATLLCLGQTSLGFEVAVILTLCVLFLLQM